VHNIHILFVYTVCAMTHFNILMLRGTRFNHEDHQQAKIYVLIVKKFLLSVELVNIGQYTGKLHYLIQILSFWTFSIVLSLSKNIVLFILGNATFRRLDSASVFR
jgi:hypothetical protein